MQASLFQIILTTVYLLFSFSILNTYAQDTQLSVSQNCPILQLSGEIDDEQASMILNIHEQEVIGHYSFDNNSKKLKVYGKLESNAIYLSQMDENLNVIAIFKGYFEGEELFGKWKYLYSQKQDFLSMKPLQPSAKRTCRFTFNISRENSNVIVGLPDNKAPFEYSILAEKQLENKSYILINYSFYSQGTCYSEGYCACGVESKLMWLELNHDFDIVNKKELLYESCLGDISNKSNKLKKQTIKLYGWLNQHAKGEFSIDLKHLEKGFTEIIQNK
ncbi:hypothetical protein HNQ88_004380 [Aureibacter tunicatorum]|uniref:Uncharacterized protein n=2 Tax=Aureibacter tunicatorum TaxID=866807 RepID=A0AAE4BUY5_9BACT|nr:hypothetical protein [Aureibacter tunicatorum]